MSRLGITDDPARALCIRAYSARALDIAASVVLGLVLSCLLFAAAACEAAEPTQGPIALHADNPHYFLWRGKPTLLITSGEHYGAVLNLDFDYVRYFRTNCRRRA